MEYRARNYDEEYVQRYYQVERHLYRTVDHKERNRPQRYVRRLGYKLRILLVDYGKLEASSR